MVPGRLLELEAALEEDVLVISYALAATVAMAMVPAVTLALTLRVVPEQRLGVSAAMGRIHALLSMTLV
jgi:hypothetical protein